VTHLMLKAIGNRKNKSIKKIVEPPFYGEKLYNNEQKW